MNVDDFKSYLEKVKENPEIIDNDYSLIESIIHNIILAEKKYTYGLEKTTAATRQTEIERIIIQGLEEYKNEN